MSYDNIRFEVSEPFALVTIDRPERTNAVDYATGQEPVDALRRVNEDDALAVGILSGTEENFCAGADLKEIVEGVDMRKRPYSLMGFLRATSRKPTIAAIEGYCVAGGMEVALWCDLRVAASGAPFVDG